MSINWRWRWKGSVELYGDKAEETSFDFASKSEAAKAVNSIFASAKCPECGWNKLDGNNVEVEITYCKLYRYESRKKFFGGHKTVPVHVKDVYRVGNYILPGGGFFGGTGYIRCPKCKWKEKAGSFWGDLGRAIISGQNPGQK